MPLFLVFFHAGNHQLIPCTLGPLQNFPLLRQGRSPLVSPLPRPNPPLVHPVLALLLAPWAAHLLSFTKASFFSFRCSPQTPRRLAPVTPPHPWLPVDPVPLSSPGSPPARARWAFLCTDCERVPLATPGLQQVMARQLWCALIASGPPWPLLGHHR